MKPLLLALALVAHLPAADPLQNMRVALPLGNGRVLIVGGEIRGDIDENRLARFPHPDGASDLQPGAAWIVPAAEGARFSDDPATQWKAGDGWTLHGATASHPAVIESLAVTSYCGGIGGHGAAIARFTAPPAAADDAYLAVPSSGTGLTPAPLTAVRPPSPELQSKLSDILLAQARAVVKDENWQVLDYYQPPLVDRIRRMNRTLLRGPVPAPQMRYRRWTPPGRPPMLLVQALWMVEEDLPLFTCDAIVEEGPSWKILSFDSTPAERMRMAEFESTVWNFDHLGSFLNAWKIGDRWLVLHNSNGYEGFTVDLTELVDGKGLLPAGVTFGAGC